MKSGNSNVLLSNENLTMQEVKCLFPKSAESTAIEKKRHPSVYRLHKMNVLWRSLRDWRWQDVWLARILLDISCCSGDMKAIVFFQKETIWSFWLRVNDKREDNRLNIKVNTRDFIKFLFCSWRQTKRLLITPSASSNRSVVFKLEKQDHRLNKHSSRQSHCS